MPDQFCPSQAGDDACLVVYSNSSSPDGWRITAGETVFPESGPGKGRMDQQSLVVRKPKDCVAGLDVDFPEREASKNKKLLDRRQPLAELRF
jgi:hypothetical protein